MRDRLLVMSEVSERIRVPISTLRHWRQIHAGPPAARIGRRVMYRQSDVDAWLRDQFQAASSVTDDREVASS